VTIALLADPASANALQAQFLKVKNILSTLIPALIAVLAPMFVLQVQFPREHNLSKNVF
jgi:hypothetical protein